MSLVYKALENAKSKNAQLAAKEPGLEGHTEKQSPSRLNAKMKWIWGVTALTVGGGLMLANAGQFGINERVASSQAHVKVKPVPTPADMSAVIDGAAAEATAPPVLAVAPSVAEIKAPAASVAVDKPFEPTFVPKALARSTEVVATMPVTVAQIDKPAVSQLNDKPAAKSPKITFAVPLAEAKSVQLPTTAVLSATPREQVTIDTRVQSENQPKRFAKTIVANDRRSQRSQAAIHTKQPYDVNLSDNGGSVSANKPQRHAALEHIISSAKQAIRSKDFTTAEIKLQSLGDIAGTESMVYKRLSAYYLSVTGDREAAATAYQNIIAMAPNDLEAGYNLALLESQLGRLEQAKNRVRFLKEQFPQSGAVDKLAKSINK
ncbi:MAG: tetratricopeptide repeat protein [Methylobacter sp.]|uniref:Tetratricopeptide repeat protein n=1 Tax=Candidatus Methylobacter titanis TaxID=3053457 RepID=A0AA43Q4L7_9GAMM|nr:tetratricopeptide repeat protein [Candidatus Methylobacter titanis]